MLLNLSSSPAPSSSLLLLCVGLVPLGITGKGFLGGTVGESVLCLGLCRVFTNLLSPLAPPFVARETLRAWQEKNHPWLELSDVHRETTENIRVTVIPFYMGMRVSALVGFFPQD